MSMNLSAVQDGADCTVCFSKPLGGAKAMVKPTVQDNESSAGTFGAHVARCNVYNDSTQLLVRQGPGHFRRFEAHRPRLQSSGCLLVFLVTTHERPQSS